MRTAPTLLPALFAGLLASAAGAALNPSYLAIPSTGAGFGQSACGIGDVNADGYSDFAVTTAQSGGVGYIVSFYFGSASGPQLELTQNNYPTPMRVCAAGDVNGDGYDDVLLAYIG